jgi:hypothetical protein
MCATRATRHWDESEPGATNAPRSHGARRDIGSCTVSRSRRMGARGGVTSGRPVPCRARVLSHIVCDGCRCVSRITEDGADETAVVHLEDVNDCEWADAGTEPRVPYVA